MTQGRPLVSAWTRIRGNAEDLRRRAVPVSVFHVGSQKSWLFHLGSRCCCKTMLRETTLHLTTPIQRDWDCSIWRLPIFPRISLGNPDLSMAKFDVAAEAQTSAGRASPQCPENDRPITTGVE